MGELLVYQRVNFQFEVMTQNSSRSFLRLLLTFIIQTCWSTGIDQPSNVKAPEVFFLGGGVHLGKNKTGVGVSSQSL